MPEGSIKPAPADEVSAFLERHPEVTTVDAVFPDLCCVFRGKRYPVAELAKLYDPGVALPGSSLLLDVNGASHDPGGYGFEDGDPDSIVRPLPGSLKPVPWSDQPIAQLMLSFSNRDGTPYPLEPRNVLRRVLERFAEGKLRPVVAFELEFYIIDRERTAGRAPQPPISPLTGERDRATQVYGMNELDAFASLLGDVHAAAVAQEIPASAASAEYAPGQFEINLRHVDDPLLAADHCVLFRRVVKGVARRHGVQTTFLAKPYPKEAGSGMHLHISLLDETGRNLFDDGSDEGSDELRHAVGGMLAGLPEAMAFYVPNPNGYRRFEPNHFVPTKANWGYENRSTAIRIPVGDGRNRRIEFRLPAADANPYLVLAAALAGIHHGLTKGIQAPPATKGNGSDALDPGLPFRLRPALGRLAEAKVLPDYLGEYCRIYRLCKEGELDAFYDIVTPMEYDWYLQAE